MANRALAWMVMLATPVVMLQAAPAPGPRTPAAPSAAVGSLSGRVTDIRGVPQMGALVTILSADGKVLHHLYSNQFGLFVQERLIPGVYGLRVNLATFLPAIKEHVSVNAGSKAFLTINLASVSDTVAGMLGAATPRNDPDSDWRWVIRSSGALRPVLRFSPGQTTPAAVQDPSLLAPYRALVELTGGGNGSAGFGGDADLSTAFSMAQSLFADTTLLLGGNVGYAHSTPVSAFRGMLRRERGDGSSHALSLTVRQIQFAGAYASSYLSRFSQTDSFMATSADYEQTAVLGDAVRLEYGASYDSVDFMGRGNSLNPHGKAVVQVSPRSTIQVSYSQGPERQRRSSADPLRDVSSQLAAFPEISLQNGAAEVERDRHAEVAYRRKVNARGTVEAAAYHDQISNFAIGVSQGSQAAQVAQASGDLLPDVFGDTASFDGGTRNISGARVAWRQGFGERIQVTASYTVAGLPVVDQRSLSSDNLDQLRGMLRNEQRHSLAVKVGGELPRTKTRIVTSYQWMNGAALLPREIFSDSLGQVDPNLNVVVHQPLPQLGLLTGKVEAVAEFRNVLGQGYIPLTTPDGQRVMLLQNVRSFRGGFAFIF